MLAACLGANQRDLEALPVIEKILKAESNYAEAYANRALIKLRAKNAEGAIEDAKMTVSLKPHLTQIWRLLGSLHYEVGSLNLAIEALRSAHKNEPENPDFMIQLGEFLRQDNKVTEAITILEQATELAPKDGKAWTNLGVAFQQEKRLAEAKRAYEKALALNPESAAIWSNLGAMAQEGEEWESAIQYFGKALEIEPNFTKVQGNLVGLLTSYTSQKKSSQPIVMIDQEIKEINLKEKTSGVISNDKIIHLFYKSSNIIKKHGLDLGTELSQTYRRNSVDLNCERHTQIFNQFNVIPKFCFGCYKVQVEPRSVLELIKLFLVFDQIKLSENNIRKCLIEMRSEISGFYKGLIYCSSLKEAYRIADYLEMVVKVKIGSGLPLAVKRGCSEYPIAFPDYKEINKSGAQLMNYNEDWKLIEENYDSKNPIKSKRLVNPSLSCLSLSDVLIIRNWIDYAKGIGDSSAQLLNQNELVSQKVYEIAKARLETHFWQESV